MPNFSPSWSRAAQAEIAHDATALSTKIVVISLPHATERRAAFSARACGAGLDWSFVDAGRGRGLNLTYDPDEAIVSKGRPLSPLVYLERARIEEGRVEVEAARDQYRQFLRGYDLPPGIRIFCSRLVPRWVGCPPALSQRQNHDR